MAIAPASRSTDSGVPPQRKAIVFKSAFSAASMSNLVSPTVTASSGEILPSFSNEAAKISGAGFELSAVPGYAAVNEIADLKQVDVILGVSLFAGSGEHDAFVVVV